MEDEEDENGGGEFHEAESCSEKDSSPNDTGGRRGRESDFEFELDSGTLVAAVSASDSSVVSVSVPVPVVVVEGIVINESRSSLDTDTLGSVSSNETLAFDEPACRCERRFDGDLSDEGSADRTRGGESDTPLLLAFPPARGRSEVLDPFEL